MNFGGPRGPFPGPIGAANSPSGRFRNIYQQSPPPNMPQSRGMSQFHHKERPVTFMPNDSVKIPKPPKQPDKPLPAYMRYSRKVWEKVKSLHPEMKMWDIGKLIGEQWRNLPEDERQGFFAEYEVEKSEYQEAMKSYHNSSAYREWLKAKEKAQQALQEQQMMEKMIGQQLPKEEPRFQLQQVEDDDDEADFAKKHIAASRFQRNHRLITEIFSEAIVPDSKSIVTKPRLENLKRQVQSLMQHQRKLESEIQDMEEKFGAKKRKILQHSEEFEEEMKKLAEPPPPLPSPKPDDEAGDKEKDDTAVTPKDNEVGTPKVDDSVTENDAPMEVTENGSDKMETDQTDEAPPKVNEEKKKDAVTASGDHTEPGKAATPPKSPSKPTKEETVSDSKISTPPPTLQEAKKGEQPVEEKSKTSPATDTPSSVPAPKADSTPALVSESVTDEKKAAKAEAPPSEAQKALESKTASPAAESKADEKIKTKEAETKPVTEKTPETGKTTDEAEKMETDETKEEKVEKKTTETSAK